MEKQILAELDSDNYHTRQEMTNIMKDKFYIRIFRPCVGRFKRME